MSNATLSIAVMSGKGGVGKSNLALNIGCAIAAKNKATLLMDCDLGLANLDVLLNISTHGNLQDVILNDRQVKEIIISLTDTGTGAFDILPAASGVPELAEMDSDVRNMLLRRLEPELGAYDYVILDLGAGIHQTVQSFAAMSAVRIIVMTPEPTSLTDSYALIKVLSANLGIKDFLVIVNEIENKKDEKESFQKLEMACAKFLNINPVLLGSVRLDPKLPEAVRKQTPLLRIFPNSPAALDIIELANRLEKVKGTMLENLSRQPVLRPLR